MAKGQIMPNKHAHGATKAGHTEFVDKTSEAVKPISLEAPKVDATASSENPSAAASTDKNEGNFFFKFS